MASKDMVGGLRKGGGGVAAAEDGGWVGGRAKMLVVRLAAVGQVGAVWTGRALLFGFWKESNSGLVVV